MLARRAGLWTCGASHGHALAFVFPLDFNAVLGLVLGGRLEDGFAKLLEEVEKYHAETLRLVVEVTNRRPSAARGARFRHQRPEPPKLPTVAWINQPTPAPRAAMHRHR